MKNMFTFILIIILVIICYHYFVRKAKEGNETTPKTRRVAKTVDGNGTRSADQNPVRRTRIGKKLDNLYDKHNKYTNEAID